MVKHSGGFHHGQVVGTAPTQVTIRLLDETIVLPLSEVTPVAPVVALLLEVLEFSEEVWDFDELVEAHHAILDRICGNITSVGSNNIPDVLEGIVEDSSMPTSEAEMTWINPKTGAEVTFALQHAVDYAYYIDGDVHPVPTTVGSSFCQPPVQMSSRRRPDSTSPSVSSNALTLFDPELDDDDDSISEPIDQTTVDAAGSLRQASRKRSSADLTDSRPTSKRRVEFQASDTAAMDAQIAQLLLGRPELTDRFLQLRSDAGPTSNLPAPDAGGGVLEQACNYQIKHQKKWSRDRSMHLPLRSLSVVFMPWQLHSITKPFPSVLGRDFAIDFGVRGLSIMHFAPFHSLNDKAVCITSGGANMQNFSAAVSVPSAPRAESIDDILEALQALATYGAEYFSVTLCGLVDTLVSFTKQQLRRMTWQKVDLVLVVDWMNSVLESFRMELEQGTNDGSLIKLRCTVDDPDFRQILIHIQQRQIADLQEALAAAQSKRSPALPKPSLVTQSHDNGQRRQNRVVKGEHSIPADVYAALPVEDGKRLCLRFLSTAGCKANNGKQCLSFNRAHFVPAQLDPIVREFIGKRFGGLKPEHNSL
ncbi:hypothetical protein PF001_g11580 [Phytophthora fragariae]|uniref:Uncharacterized protein n=1 Tax=Phytophthora fragariae TaxID=53985 RepID=A0A6A4DTT7_9STRA|nr:hypothetical protein PF001_g11580 [Phytophthora fragariae]